MNDSITGGIGILLLKPTKRDWHVIFHYSGRLTTLIGIMMVVPVITGVIFAEWNAVLDFVIGGAIAVSAGLLLSTIFRETSDLTAAQGLVIVATGWILATLTGAIPLYLSGHYLSYLDACFDSMSGLATAGLALIQDLDHAGNAINMWRHLMQFVGGMGIVVAGLSLFLRVSGAGGASVYSGEAREDKILPNVVRTTRVILIISVVYLVIGTTALTASFLAEGMEPVRGLLHGLWIFMAAFSTGGYAPQSPNLLYYHSALIEIVTIPLMIAGALSFGLHHAIWSGQRSEIRRNIEPVTLLITGTLLTAGVTAGLMAIGAYSGMGAVFRKGAYQLISAQTTTGFQTVYGAQFGLEWGALALLCMMVAMGTGASASSTGGGIKALRIALTYKTFALEVKKLVLPDHAVVAAKYHHFTDKVLSDQVIRNTLLVLGAFMFTFFAGAALAMFYGYSFTDALFESTSAAATVGLSSGVTSASMPAPLKVMYILEMWAGRLEFLSVWAFGALVYAAVRGK